MPDDLFNAPRRAPAASSRRSDVPHTGIDATSRAGSDATSRTGNDATSRTGNDATSRTGNDATSRTGRGARAVAELIPAAGDKAFRRFGFMQNAVVARWAEIVGELYARYSTPEAISFPAGKKAGGTLKVVVTGSFAPMLKHVEPQVVERVNAFFGYPAVARLALRHGDLPTVRRAARPVPQPLSAETESTLRDVADPDLRASLESLARALSATTGPPTVR